jgi:hypothetical protein
MKTIGVLGRLGRQATMDFEPRVHQVAQRLSRREGIVVPSAPGATETCWSEPRTFPGWRTPWERWGTNPLEAASPRPVGGRSTIIARFSRRRLRP